MALPDWIEAVLISSAYLAVLIGLEAWHRTGRPPVEWTRELAHVSAGLVCVSFACVFPSHGYVLGMVVAFMVLMIVTRRAGLLPSIHGVDRPSKGSIYFPLAVYLLFVLSSAYDRPQFYVISLLILTIADTLAALIGKAYGRILYRVEAIEKKSLEGSAIFFLTTFVIVLLGLLLLDDAGRLESILCAVLVALLVSAFESISPGGSDNLFIPLGAWLVLMRCTELPAAGVAGEIALVGVVVLAVFCVVSLPNARLGGSALVGVALLGYSAWSVAGFPWFLAVLTAASLFCHTRLFFEHVPASPKPFRIRPVFYAGLLPFLWISYAALQPDIRPILVLPFLVSIAAQLGISWRNNSRFFPERMSGHYPAFLVHSNPVTRAASIVLLFVPLQLAFEPRLSIVYSLAAGFLGLLAIDISYWLLGRRFKAIWQGAHQRVNFLRLSLALRTAVTVLIFAGHPLP